MAASSESHFKHNYQTYLKHLKLKGLQPKTVEAFARGIRRFGAYFDERIEGLSEAQLTDYFTDSLASHSWSSVKRCSGHHAHYQNAYSAAVHHRNPKPAGERNSEGTGEVSSAFTPAQPKAAFLRRGLCSPQI
jgi:site-specific recombinase XerD